VGGITEGRGVQVRCSGKRGPVVCPCIPRTVIIAIGLGHDRVNIAGYDRGWRSGCPVIAVDQRIGIRDRC